MKLGYDVDGVITDAPEYYSILFKALRKDGHKVILITDYDKHFRSQRIKELKSLDIDYDELVITADKLGYCQENQIKWFVGDHAGEYFPNSKIIPVGIVKL